MKILSIYPYTHISSAALMINGKLVAASPEERFNRKKMSTDFPINSINWCLKEHSLKLEEIDLIVIPWNPSINLNSVSGRWVNEMRWRGEMITNIAGNLLRLNNGAPPDRVDLNLGHNKIVFLNHHECHAASAFFTSPFANSDILTIDGHGEEDSCFLGFGKNDKIIKKQSIQYPHSVGLFYGTFTDFLGFKPDSDEWKVMALASYGKKNNTYDKKVEKLFKLSEGKFELDLSYFRYYLFDRKKTFFSDKFINLFCNTRKSNDKINKHHYLIANAMQRAFEKIVFYLVKNLKKRGGKSNNLVLAGGAAMNCVFNGLLNKSKIYKNVFIPAYPDDLGVSIGATYLANLKFNKKYKRKILNEKHNFFGPSFDRSFIKSELKKFKVKFRESINVEQETAKFISEGKLIGWFQGKMEFSHRALGNRSILGDPRNPNMKKIINSAIKFREGFRPFAPAVLEEDASTYFEMNGNERIHFMEKISFVRKKWRKKLPAITHKDNSARVQTVSKQINKKFYNLIYEFKNITNTPILVNTSFNLNGEPIVCSPNDAIRTFFSCGLDVLVMDNFIIEK